MPRPRGPLSPTYARVVQLYLSGHAPAAIGRELGRPASWARSAVQRLRQRGDIPAGLIYRPGAPGGPRKPPTCGECGATGHIRTRCPAVRARVSSPVTGMQKVAGSGMVPADDPFAWLSDDE